MDSSYRRYRKYQENRYRYKMDQIAAPIAMMLIIGFVTKYWWIIVAIILVTVIVKCSEKSNKKKITNEPRIICSKDIVTEYKKNMHYHKEELESMSTTETGYVNRNNQRNNGKTSKPGTDYGQWFYDMECLKCGHKYYANGSNIYEKKCPSCQVDSQSKREGTIKNSTERGYVNKNNQRNNGKTSIPGTGNGQWFYDMECLNCGHKYHANGHDVWLRKCPKCQGGRP